MTKKEKKKRFDPKNAAACGKSKDVKPVEAENILKGKRSVIDDDDDPPTIVVGNPKIENIEQRGSGCISSQSTIISENEEKNITKKRRKSSSKDKNASKKSTRTRHTRVPSDDELVVDQNNIMSSKSSFVPLPLLPLKDSKRRGTLPSINHPFISATEDTTFSPTRRKRNSSIQKVGIVEIEKEEDDTDEELLEQDQQRQRTSLPGFVLHGSPQGAIEENNDIKR